MEARTTRAWTTRGVTRTLREAAQLFWAAADGYVKRRLLFVLILVASGSLLTAFTPVALKLVVDSLSRGANGAQRYLTPLSPVILYVLGQYAWRCAYELRALMQGHAEQRVRRRVGRRLFEHLVRLPLRFHLERKTGAMGETAEQGIRGYQLLIMHTTHTVLPVLIEFVAVAAVLTHFGQAKYLAILGVASVAYLIAFYRGAKAVKESSWSASKAHIEAHAVLTDSLLNHETVKYFDAEPIVSARYDVALGQTESAWYSFYTRRTLNGVAVASIFAASLGTALFLATGDVARGAMTIGDFVLVNAYLLRLVQPIEMLGNAVRDIAQGVAFLQSMLDLFAQQPEHDCSGALPAAQATRGELAFERVSFSYRQEARVLKDVSFTVPAGRTAAVVGASGSGKSSLIRLLFRLYEPDKGRILLDGVPVAEMSLSAVRRSIAIVNQEPVLFHDTIGSNIGFGRLGATRPEIEDAARLAHLHDAIVAMPDGYDTVVGERGLKLSGGERQRVAIARAALKQPVIAVFDEATSSLDSRTEAEILRNLDALSSRHTTLIIAHRLSTVIHADEILVLHEGEIAERGTHEELLVKRGYYAALWHAQQGATQSRKASIA